jgi:hypothetical protein
VGKYPSSVVMMDVRKTRSTLQSRKSTPALAAGGIPAETPD